MYAKRNLRLAVYILCFIGLCFIDWILGTQSGRLQMAAINLVGIVLAVIYCISIDLSSFLSKKYLIIVPIEVVGMIIAIVWGYKNYEYIGQWVTAAIDAGIYLVLAVNIFDRIRKKEAFVGVNKLPLFVGILTFVLMIFSHYDGLWPILYGVALLAFLSINFDEERLKTFYTGGSIGVVIGFLMIQGLAFVFRPYDESRYKGMHANCNMNGLLYIQACVAMLILICFLNKYKKLKWLVILLNIIVVYTGGLICLTGSRTALVTYAAIIMFYLIFRAIISSKHVRSFILRGLAFGVGTLIAIPIAYLTIRYIPPIFHHPIWYETEYSTERVHSFDPIDSEKYVDFETAITVSIGRFLFFDESLRENIFDKVFGDESDETVANEIVLDDITENEIVQDETTEDETTENETIQNDIVENDEPMTDENVSVAGPPQNLDLRDAIRRYYFEHSTLFGNPKSAAGYQVAYDYNAPHAHNVFVQFMFDFGFISFISFAIYMIFMVIALVKYMVKKKYFYVLVLGLISIAFFTFGYFEIDWRSGQLSMVLLLLSQYGIIYDIGKIDGEEKKNFI